MRHATRKKLGIPRETKPEGGRWNQGREARFGEGSSVVVVVVATEFFGFGHGVNVVGSGSAVQPGSRGHGAVPSFGFPWYYFRGRKGPYGEGAV